MVRYEYTKAELIAVNRFIKSLPEYAEVDEWDYSQACYAYTRAEAAWLRYTIYRRHGIPILCWYRHKRGRVNREWRPKIIMRVVLEAGLSMEGR